VFRRSTLGAAVLLALGSATQALPQDGSVIAGSGSIGTAGNALTVTQHTQKLIIDWQGFGIAAGESVQFIQPGSDAVALNRVLGNNASAIFGSLSANGQVFLVNPNGILFGSSAQVNVGGLVASTLGISNDDFLAGNYAFAGSGGSVVNQGALTAADGGVIALLAPEVRNEGIIVAREGSIGLGAGTRVTLGFVNGFMLEVEESALNAVIENRHAIRAEGGVIILSASAQRALLAGMVNNTGVIEAGSLTEAGGVIRLHAGQQQLGGRLDASGTQGGDITITGSDLALVGAQISADGDSGGGRIRIGGDFQGANAALPNARTTFVDAGSVLSADATAQGDGGRIIVWSDARTVFNGRLSARGGTQGGDGGFAEVSGKQALGFAGHASLQARQGTHGTLLLDPRDIVISSSAATLALGGDIAYGDDPGQDLALHPDALLGILNTGTNLTLQASNDIVVNAALAVDNTAGDGGDLTLQAGRSLALNATLDTDNGSLTLIANDLAANGVVAADRAPGNASLSVAAAIDAGSGNVSLQLRNGQANAGGTLSVTGAISANTIAIRQDSGAGFTLDAPLASTATSGTGIEIVVPTFTALTNGALGSAPGSRWLVWSGDPADDSRGSLAYDFKQYNAVHGSASVLGSGNGFLYGVAPVINRNALTGTGKVYDGTTAFTGALDFAASDAIDGDTVTFAAAIAAFADRNAGSAKAVNLTGVTLAGASDGSAAVYGYQFTGSGAATAAITSKTVNATGIVANDKVYDGTATATLDLGGAVLSGSVAGDAVVLATGAASATFDNHYASVGKIVTVNGLALTGADAGNYSLAATTTTATIQRKPLLATGITASDRVYDGTTGATLNVEGVGLSGAVGADRVALSPSIITGAFADRHAGSDKSVIVTIAGFGLTGAESGNYTLAPYTTTATITPIGLSAAGITALDKVFDGTTVATLDLSGASLAGILAGDDVWLAASGAFGSFADRNVGSDKTVTVSALTLFGSDAGNYSFNTYTTTADITPKALTITANDQRIVTGQAVPAFDYRIDGLVASDTAAVISGLQVGSSAPAYPAPGFYAITASGGSAQNYLISHVDGTLTVDLHRHEQSARVAQEEVRQAAARRLPPHTARQAALFTLEGCGMNLPPDSEEPCR
jgi:filamentous hemagglutinin family protein